MMTSIRIIEEGEILIITVPSFCWGLLFSG